MISIVCCSSLLLGLWSLKWDEKTKRFKISYYFFLASLLMMINLFMSIYGLLKIVLKDNSMHFTPQILILYVAYSTNCILVINRLITVGHTRYFANELMTKCGRTVESGRSLPDFWFRIGTALMTVYMLYYKHTRFSNASYSVGMVIMRLFVAVGGSVFVTSTMECQYTAACRALTEEFAAVNQRTRTVISESRCAGVTTVACDATNAQVIRLSDAHCRLTRLVRLFNDEYGVPIFCTTVHLLLGQIYVVNDVVSIFVADETFQPSYAHFIYLFDGLTLALYWYRLWWICHRMDSLTAQIHLTAKIVLEKDINSFPEKMRKLVLDFLSQLLHRHVKITAWGFYDVNKELLFMILGYQFGLSLICTQFSTSSVQLANDLTTSQKNVTHSV